MSMQWSREYLYKRDTKGKIRIWYMEYTETGYRTISGLEDGEKVTSSWTLVEPKNIGKTNETSPSEQVMLEMESHYIKKKDAGYFDDIKKVDDPILFKAMLAHGYEGGLKYPVYSQPKLDGARCIATSSGLFTRNGKKYVSVPHIIEQLQPLFDADPDLILDGELYNHDLHDDFNKIMSLVKKLKPTYFDFQESKKLVEYHVYDCPSVDDNFDVRFNFLFEKLPILPSIKMVLTHTIYNQEDLDSLYASYLEEGYEGQMIRLNTPYENKRTKNLLKRKEFQDVEAKILEIQEGQGNWAGYAKHVLIEVNGKQCLSGMRGSQEFCKHLLNEKDQYVGGTVTIRFQNYTPDGIPRFPVAVAFYKGKRDI